MNDQYKDFNQEEFDMDISVKDDQAQQLPEQRQVESLRDVLRDYDLKDIIAALGVSDVLDAISAHDIADYICYIVMKRKDMREPHTRRQIFRREVVRLADDVNSEW